MKQGIYQIENNINHKKYIGQSTHIEARWHAHKTQFNKHLDGSPLLYKAFVKYGIENFTFSILEEVLDESLLNEKETYYILTLSTLAPDGYNCILPTDVLRGENNPHAKNTKIVVDEIKRLLETTQLSIENIAKMFNTTASSVYRINRGENWTDSNREYPIRKTNNLARIGSANGRAIFTEDEVLKIREQYVTMSISELYEIYKDRCSLSGLKKIAQGTTFKHLPIYSKTMKKWINK